MSVKTALVTGAASGIGFAVAQSLAAQGYKVLVTDLNKESAEKATEQLLATGAKARAQQLDVSKQADIDSIFDQVGSIDILVNNAGLQHVAKLEEFPVDKWKLLIDVLLTGPAMLTRAALPGMKANGFGRIVNIGSIHALIASPYKSAYVAAKHGLIGFSKTIALETAEQDITINTICPAYVRTPYACTHA
jgi:3-hydroxybutyrate dehydrogenase